MGVGPARREKKSEAMSGDCTPDPAIRVGGDRWAPGRLSGQVGQHATGLFEC